MLFCILSCIVFHYCTYASSGCGESLSLPLGLLLHNQTNHPGECCFEWLMTPGNWFSRFQMNSWVKIIKLNFSLNHSCVSNNSATDSQICTGFLLHRISPVNDKFLRRSPVFHVRKTEPTDFFSQFTFHNQPEQSYIMQTISGKKIIFCFSKDKSATSATRQVFLIIVGNNSQPLDEKQVSPQHRVLRVMLAFRRRNDILLGS